MAEANIEDVSSMSTEMLLDYLQDQGISGTDLEKIQGMHSYTMLENRSYFTINSIDFVFVEGGYNGKTILLLAEDNNERLYKLKLTDSSTAVLEDLLEVSVVVVL